MKTFFALVATLVLTGCANYATGRYQISPDNAYELRSFSGLKINVGEFSDKNNTTAIACHFHGPVTTLDGETFAKYIRKALISELKMANLYSETAPLTISANLDKIDYSTAFGSNWEIALTLTLSDGKKVTVTEKYDYAGSIFADSGGECVQAALAFAPAVQNIIGKVIMQLPKPTIVN